jgi:ABC-type Fe3+-hydroxamate transport system substrate-binding protein
MKRLLVAAAAALALAGCMQQIGQQRQSATACSVSASDTWSPASAGEFSIEATTTGPDCQRAVATLVIRDAQGQVAWVEAYSTEDIMVLAPAHDVAAMRAALAEWIAPESNTTMQSTSALPEWPTNADSPQSGEFPFYPEAGYDRDSYNTLRTNNLPLYCFVQGMESMACLALSDGGLEKIGVQSFPG